MNANVEVFRTSTHLRVGAPYPVSGPVRVCGQQPTYLAREFVVNRPNQGCCGETTYIWGGQRWIYLAVVLDLYARRVAAEENLKILSGIS